MMHGALGTRLSHSKPKGREVRRSADLKMPGRGRPADKKGSSLFGVGVDVRPRCVDNLELRNSGKREENGDSPQRRWMDWATGLKIVELLAGCKTIVLLRHQAGEIGPWIEGIA